MINLTKTQQIIHEFRFFIAATAVILILAFVVVIKTVNFSGQKTTYNFQVSKDISKQTKNTQVNYKAESLTLPTKMATYSSNTTPLNINQAAMLAEKLGFVTKPTIIPADQNDSIYLWKNPNESLSIKLTSQTIHYSKKIDFKQNTTITNTKDGVLNTHNFINKLGLNFSTINFDSPEIQYLDSLESAPQASSTSAHFLNLSYYPTIDNKPVIGSNAAKASIETVVDSKMQVNVIDIDLKIASNLSANNEISTKTFEQVVQELKDGKGTYLKSTSSDLSQGKPPAIVTLNITKSTLAYIQKPNSDTQTIYLPVVKFDGQAQLINSKTENVVIVVPVIENVLFNSL